MTTPPRPKEPTTSVGDLIHQLEDAVRQLNDGVDRLERATDVPLDSTPTDTPRKDHR